MKTRFDIISLILVFLAAGCVRNEFSEELTVKEKMVFAAYTEGEDETKTTLDGEVGSSARKVMWDIDDAIGIVAEENSTFEKFINTQTDPSAKGLFEGTIRNSENYYAIYPYDETFKKSGSVINFSLPSVQIYKENSFGTDCSPMVAKKSTGEDLKFKNLCGVLVLRITGDFSVKSITFMAKDESGNYMKVSGGASVDMAYVRTPEMVMADDASTSVELDCGDGVQLSASESTPFHIVLPVGVYNTFELVVTSTDGDILTKEGLKPLTISRSMATKTGDFTPGEVAYIDLSLRGTANCYVVSEKGYYSIDVSVIGNGEKGIIKNANFHTESEKITPASANILWATSDTLILLVSYNSSNNRIYIYTSGEEGNAVIAARDENSNIVWSWHIWCTDQPHEQKYVNSAGTFYVLDRNLGATRNNRGSTDQELKESMGTLYFWGRKDPFDGKNHVSPNKRNLTIGETISNPFIIHSTSVGTSTTTWLDKHNDYLWSDESKTIYDPCPVGYKVASNVIWSGFTFTGEESEDVSEFNVSGTYDKGWNFYVDESKSTTAWYPAPHYYDWPGMYIDGNSQCIAWASNFHSAAETHQYNLLASSSKIDPCSKTGCAQGFPVRCMKDEDYMEQILPKIYIKEVSNVTTNSAEIIVEVTSEGISSMLERGIIVGESSDVTLENGTKYSSGTGVGEFSVDLSDLVSLTRYYVKAYATNADGTAYSQAMTFITEYEGDPVDLSAAGTANSYIVGDDARDFIFNGSVKGNSTELVGTPASAEVLWETKNTEESVSKGDIISSVSLMDGGFVQFSIPTEYTPGNALIAVKDADGVILWSWHIWVADFDPVTTQQTYQSGAVMMDRNLGALNVQENDPKAYGFLYQWGRKDPMGGVATSNSFVKTYPDGVFTRKSTSSINEAIQNPTDFGSTSSWCGDNTLWQSEKSKYDPCPVGWRVPDGGPDGVWSGFGAYSQDVTNGAYFDAPYSTPRAFYPRGGYAYCGDSEVYFHGSTSYHWSCTPDGSAGVYDFQLWSGQGRPSDSRNKESLFNVRCQKEE